MGAEQRKSYQRVGNLGSGWSFAVETSKTKNTSQNRITANCHPITVIKITSSQTADEAYNVWV